MEKVVEDLKDHTPDLFEGGPPLEHLEDMDGRGENVVEVEFLARE